MAEHTVKAFDTDITQLRGLIAEMGGLAEVAIADAVDALVRHDTELAKQVVAGDAKLDALEADATLREAVGDAFCQQFLALKRDEWTAYAQHVSAWELARYADAF